MTAQVSGSRNLILVMLIIVAAGVLIARSYYGKLNRSVDPRIQPARELYGKYDQVALGGNYNDVFALLDSIENIYLQIPYYRNSFELGVLENNRAAALLTIALFSDSIPEDFNPYSELDRDSIIRLAEIRIKNAINIYEAWNSVFMGKSEEVIEDMIREKFIAGLEAYEIKQVEAFLQNRVKECRESTEENKHRLSVCHTNLGVIYRISKDYAGAIREYEVALELWERNLEAENNLNRLLNRPLKKRNFLQKMFPPQKKK